MVQFNQVEEAGGSSIQKSSEKFSQETDSSRTLGSTDTWSEEIDSSRTLGSSDTWSENESEEEGLCYSWISLASTPMSTPDSIKSSFRP